MSELTYPVDEELGQTLSSRLWKQTYEDLVDERENEGGLKLNLLGEIKEDASDLIEEEIKEQENEREKDRVLPTYKELLDEIKEKEIKEQSWYQWLRGFFWRRSTPAEPPPPLLIEEEGKEEPVGVSSFKVENAAYVDGPARFQLYVNPNGWATGYMSDHYMWDRLVYGPPLTTSGETRVYPKYYTWDNITGEFVDSNIYEACHEDVTFGSSPGADVNVCVFWNEIYTLRDKDTRDNKLQRYLGMDEKIKSIEMKNHCLFKNHDERN